MVDGHIAVHPVPVGADDMLRRAADQPPVGPDPHRLVVTHCVEPAVRRAPHPGEQPLQHSGTRDQRTVRTTGRPFTRTAWPTTRRPAAPVSKQPYQ